MPFSLWSSRPPRPSPGSLITFGVVTYLTYSTAPAARRFFSGDSYERTGVRRQSRLFDTLGRPVGGVITNVTDAGESVPSRIVDSPSYDDYARSREEGGNEEGE